MGSVNNFKKRLDGILANAKYRDMGHARDIDTHKTIQVDLDELES